MDFFRQEIFYIFVTPQTFQRLWYCEYVLDTIVSFVKVCVIFCLNTELTPPPTFFSRVSKWFSDPFSRDRDRQLSSSASAAEQLPSSSGFKLNGVLKAQLIKCLQNNPSYPQRFIDHLFAEGLIVDNNCLEGCDSVKQAEEVVKIVSERINLPPLIAALKLVKSQIWAQESLEILKSANVLKRGSQ